MGFTEFVIRGHRVWGLGMGLRFKAGKICYKTLMLSINAFMKGLGFKAPRDFPQLGNQGN